MDEYIMNVSMVCSKLLKGLNLKNKFDFYEYRRIHDLTEFKVNEIKYQLHGKGCIAYSDEMYINWNFGYRSRWCGIDPWLLAITLKENKSPHIDFFDGHLVNQICERAVLENVMFKKDTLYYFTIPVQDTFRPKFPKHFDTLIINHFNEQWIIPRNKVVDRFIRKSTWIYNAINNSPNPYTLKFILNGNEVFSMPYDDIGYPANAIKIMDEILICCISIPGSK